MSNSHKNTMFLPDDIRPITLITTGRTGTDFFQSLLDGHESIATLNGHIYIYEFLDRSKCLKERINSTFSKDIFYEFYWSEIDKFKSEYDQIENKKESYLPVKLSGLWIKENSNKEDVVLSKSVPQTYYYSERETYGVPKPENFEEEIKGKNVKYVIVSVFEMHPENLM